MSHKKDDKMQYKYPLGVRCTFIVIIDFSAEKINVFYSYDSIITTRIFFKSWV